MLPSVAAALIRLVGSTIRFQLKDEERIFDGPKRGSVIMAFWHNRIFLMPYVFEKFIKNRNLFVMISRSRDGQWIADVSEKFGIQASRGSSSKGGGIAFRHQLSILRDPGTDAGVTPDGPRGPRYEVQQGVIKLASVAGSPIIPLTYRLSRKIELPSWDRFQIPLPFARCEFTVGAPIHVPRKIDEAGASSFAALLASALTKDG